MSVYKNVMNRQTQDCKSKCCQYFSNRILVGRLVGNVHELYINKTVLTDEDTYACEITGVFGSDLLTVNGEYLDRNISYL